MSTSRPISVLEGRASTPELERELSRLKTKLTTIRSENDAVEKEIRQMRFRAKQIEQTLGIK